MIIQFIISSDDNNNNNIPETVYLCDSQLFRNLFDDRPSAVNYYHLIPHICRYIYGIFGPTRVFHVFVRSLLLHHAIYIIRVYIYLFYFENTHALTRGNYSEFQINDVLQSTRRPPRYYHKYTRRG